MVGRTKKNGRTNPLDRRAVPESQVATDQPAAGTGIAIVDRFASVRLWPDQRREIGPSWLLGRGYVRSV